MGLNLLSAHSIGVMQLRLAFDCASSMSHLIATDEITAIYSPAALLRPVLEAAGRALWVLDTNVGVRERILRGMNERLTSLYWQKNLPMKEAKKHATERTRQIHEAAQQLGFDVIASRKGRPRYLEPGPPSHRAVIKGLFEGYNRDPGLPKSLTLLADSVSHAGTLGLTAYLEPVQLGPALQTQVGGKLRMTARDANLILTASLVSLLRAGSERIELQRLPDQEWGRAAHNSMAAATHVLGEYVSESASDS